VLLKGKKNKRASLNEEKGMEEKKKEKIIHPNVGKNIHFC